MTATILGIATATPPHVKSGQEINELFDKHAKPSKALTKTKFINLRTEIQTRRFVQDGSSELLARADLPLIDEVNLAFLDKGVALAVEAARLGLADWGGDTANITHLIATSCTCSAHPGPDILMAQQLGLSPNTSKIMITGVGCSGGVAILRTAKAICEGDPNARVLCIAVEITSSLIRTELKSMDDTGHPNIPICLFSDGASAIIVGGGDIRPTEKVSFEIVKSHTETIPGTLGDLCFDVCTTGWKAVITHNVPIIAGSHVPPLLERLLPPGADPKAYDHFIHPGGSLIITSVEEGLGLNSQDHSRASWDVYRSRGNMSSASIGHVLEIARRRGGRREAIATAFGPGVNIELLLLRRPAPPPCRLRLRPRMIELHEQPWTHPAIRDGVQKILTKVWTTRIAPMQQRAPVECVGEVLEEVIRQLEEGNDGTDKKGDGQQQNVGGDITVVDFCSGAGGPMKEIERLLNARRSQLSLSLLSFLLTDLYPPASPPSETSTFRYLPVSINALSPGKALQDALGSSGGKQARQIRTFCLAFHHFDEDEARSALVEGMKDSEAICIFELQEFNLTSFLTITLLGPLTLLLAPFTSLTLVQLFFTYVIPIIPFIVVVDGYVSATRTREMTHMRALIDQAAASTDLIDPSAWVWEEGRRSHFWPLGKLWYLVGRRKGASTTGTTGSVETAELD